MGGGGGCRGRSGLKERLGVTVIIGTHDPAIADRVHRVVTIRDGRTSTETFRRMEMRAGAPRVVHDDYAIVDSAGRLQIPRTMLERLEIADRARLDFAGDRVEVRPERPTDERG